MDLNNAYQLVKQKIDLWLKEIIRLLPNILVAAIVLVIGFYIAGWIKKLGVKLIGKISHNPTLNRLLSSVLYIFVLGIVIFTTLNILHLDKAVTSILAGAGILGLALAFAFQDIASNFISGVFISFRRPVHLGDIVKIKDYMGKVEEINLRDTVIRTFQGQMVIIPNKDVFQNPIENFTLLGKRRFDLVIGVSYGEDLEKVKEITLDAVKDLKGMSDTDEPTLFYQKFDDSSINFVLRLWTKSVDQPDYLSLGSEAIMLLKKVYDKNNIQLPFPVRTLDLDVRGGIPLDKMLIHIANDSKEIENK